MKKIITQKLYPSNRGEIVLYFDEESNEFYITQAELEKLFSRHRTTILRTLTEFKKDAKNEVEFKHKNSDSVQNAQNSVQNAHPKKLYFCDEKLLHFFDEKFKSSEGKKLNDWMLNNGIFYPKVIDNNNEIFRYNRNDIVLDVYIAKDDMTAWLTQEQIALLFDTTVANIALHIRKIYESKELEKNRTLKFYLIVVHENNREVERKIAHYNLSMIIAIGFRVKSSRGIEFRKWANSKLEELIQNGKVELNKDTDKFLIHLSNEFKEFQKDVKSRLINIETKLKDYSFPDESIIYEGTVFRAFTLFKDLVKRAKKKLIIVDPYADEVILSILTSKSHNVTPTVITTRKSNITLVALDKFKDEYGDIKIIKTNAFHDRFIVVDNDIYHVGSSLNNAGNSISCVIKLDEGDLKEFVSTYIDKIILTNNLFIN